MICPVRIWVKSSAIIAALVGAIVALMVAMNVDRLAQIAHTVSGDKRAA